MVPSRAEQDSGAVYMQYQSASCLLRQVVKSDGLGPETGRDRFDSATGRDALRKNAQHQGLRTDLLCRVLLDHGRKQLQVAVDDSVGSHVSVGRLDGICGIDPLKIKQKRVDECIVQFRAGSV